MCVDNAFALRLLSLRHKLTRLVQYDTGQLNNNYIFCVTMFTQPSL